MTVFLIIVEQKVYIDLLEKCHVELPTFKEKFIEAQLLYIFRHNCISSFSSFSSLSFLNKMSAISALVDYTQPTFYFALAHILFNPIFWNTAARAGKKEAFFFSSLETYHIYI